jgi:hypothetical protein
MIISDLNHVESISETTSVLGGFSLGYDYSNVYFNENFNLNKFIRSNVYVSGHAATAESDASAYGYGSLTQTFNNAVTDLTALPLAALRSRLVLASTTGY